MAQTVWFLRHGEAEPHGIKLDSDRELTEKGRRQARDAGLALARLKVDLDHVFMSPKVRARDTALLACEALGIEPITHEPLARGFDIGELLDLVAGFGDEAQIMVVGHEPTFSQAVYDLTGGRIEMKKGGIAVVQLRQRRGVLNSLLRPRQLRAIASSS